MVAVVSLCYAICLREGIIAFEHSPPKMKLDKKAGNFFPIISTFTKGYELVEEVVF